MGTFSVDLQVGDLAGRQFIQVAALVDIGSSDTVLPREILEESGVKVVDRFAHSLADERVALLALPQCPLGTSRVGDVAIAQHQAAVLHRLVVDPQDQPVRHLLLDGPRLQPDDIVDPLLDLSRDLAGTIIAPLGVVANEVGERRARAAEPLRIVPEGAKAGVANPQDQVGIEDADDIMEDLEQGLAQA